MYFLLCLCCMLLLVAGLLEAMRRFEKERRELYDRFMAKSLSEFRSLGKNPPTRKKGRLKELREHWQRTDISRPEDDKGKDRGKVKKKGDNGERAGEGEGEDEG